jgi:hypothetical protein
MKNQMDRMIEHIDEMVLLDKHTEEGMYYLEHFRRVAEAYKQRDEYGFQDGFIIGVAVGIIFACLGVVLFLKLYI